MSVPLKCVVTQIYTLHSYLDRCCNALTYCRINGYATERFGHRYVIMVGLVIMSGLIFITAFAPSIEVLCVGQVLVGIPWGIFSIMGSAYASEVCPLALRGYLLSFVNICWVLVRFRSDGIRDDYNC